MTGKSKYVFLIVITLLGMALLALPLIQVAVIAVDEVSYVVWPGFNATVTLEYLHSVELMKVVETYEVVGCEVRLARLVWPGHGAGLSSTPNDLPVQVTDSSGGYVAENISLGPVVKASMRHRVDARLVINGREIPCNEGIEIRACVRVPLAALLLQPRV